MRLQSLLSILLFSILTVIDTAAQIKIDGTITDADSNPISNALIEIIDQDDTTNYYSANTNDSGYFAISNITDITNRISTIPSDFITLRNYPNPFNPSTIIYYELPKSENIEIKIYDILGREIRTLFDNFHKAGTYTLYWDGRNNWNSPVAAGVYLCRLKTKDNFKVHKMLLLDGGTPSSSFNASLNNNANTQIEKNSNAIFNYSIRISGEDIIDSKFDFLSCSGDTTLNLLVPRILQTAVIGPEGGKLETEDFLLTIPGGTFVQEETLSLAIETDSSFFEEEIFSKPFRVDGIPELFYQDLSMKIKLNMPPTDSISIAVGEIDTATLFDYEFINYDYYSAEDSSGYAIANIISPFTNNSNLSKSINKFNIEKSKYEKKLIVVLTSPNAVLSSNGNFKIYYPDSKALYIPIIDEYLEDAVKVVESLGFTKLPLRSVLTSSNWPVKVKFNKGGGNDTFLESRSLASIWIQGSYIKVNNKDYLKKNWEIIINSAGFSESFPENLQRTLGRDVFRNFVHQNNLYRNDPSIYKWITTALNIWVPELFPQNSNFIPWIYDFNNSELPKDLEINVIKEILEGIYLDKNDKNYVKHVIAFSALIDYFTTSTDQGDKIIYEIYQKIRSENTSEDALIKTMNQTENIWWPNFFKGYVQGNIYNVPADKFLGNISETIEIEEDDTLKEVNDKYTIYNDLSAKLFRINIKSNDLRSEGLLNFKIGPKTLNLDYIKALVFGISGNRLTFISEGLDFLIGNLYKYDGLLACVVNSGNEPPYSGTSKIELEIRIKESSLPFEGNVNLRARFSENLHYKSDTEEYDITGADYIDHGMSGKVKLINDSTYWGEWDEKDQIGYNHKGSMTVVIDPNTKNLKYFEADEVRDIDRGAVATEKMISYSLNLSPFSTGTFYWNFMETDNRACTVLQTLEYKEVAASWEQTLLQHYCSANSFISVYFNFEE